ncbi:MAG: tRNA pseudouridine(38-40) synthase TruA [Lachnospiraceae bacterium]|nr:tRNA pseudouridine(38-40) synthase TruA [Lachnospiraceae bacterium]
MRVRLTISYDGTNYHGWQIQPNGITIQSEINRALSEVFGGELSYISGSESKAVTIGASRTDAGVHARGNVAVFDTTSRMPAEKVAYALNQHLPPDIVVKASTEVSPDFNPRFEAKKKTYSYKILSSKFPDPLIARYSLFHHYELDTENMAKAGAYLTGEHDFTSFSSIHSQTNSFVRTIYDLGIRRENELVIMEVSGNGFLYNMVRIIAGTLIQVGDGIRKPDEIKRILEGKDRELAGPTAPAHGLCLERIEYDPKGLNK